MLTTIPLITAPLSILRVDSLSSKRAAKDSVMIYLEKSAVLDQTRPV
jgi:hypothetical protein